MGILQFSDNEKFYIIPQEIDLLPEMLLDEHRGVYRVVLGGIYLSEEQKALYKIVFDEITGRMKGIFLEDFTFYAKDKSIGDPKLYATLASVDQTDTMMELEIAIGDATFDVVKEQIVKEKKKKNDNSGRNNATKNKKTKRNSKTTSTRVSR